jgi:NADPH:quinone reductase-like Zn-dependent oxidoreductase
MNALVVDDFEKAPSWKRFQEPTAGEGEVVVQVTASALSNLVKAQSNGTHYSSVASFPFVPGVDGTGRLADGTRVYFFSPKRPFGAMGEKSLARKELCVPLPADLPDPAAAALANPVMSSWAALTRRARFVRGEAVLINGATGASGKLAVQVARHLGASAVVAAGRSSQILDSLGADRTISLTLPPKEQVKAFRSAVHDHGVTVVLDYLWGPSAEACLTAIGGPGGKHSDKRVRYVQIGSISGNSIPFSASLVRSTALEVMGSGLGSVSDVELVRSIGEAFAVAVQSGFSVETVQVKMSDGEAAWPRDHGRKRLVFTL